MCQWFLSLLLRTQEQLLDKVASNHPRCCPLERECCEKAPKALNIEIFPIDGHLKGRSIELNRGAF